MCPILNKAFVEAVFLGKLQYLLRKAIYWIRARNKVVVTYSPLYKLANSLSDCTLSVMSKRV